MNILNLVIQNIEAYYNLASGYFDNIVPKSISILMDHDFIPTPCVKIKMNLFKDEKEIGTYYLYVNDDKEFIDEFLIIK